MEILAAVGRPLLWRKHYPEGARQLQYLLDLTLPGVDANDPHKTYATLTFYFSMCSDGR
jgi:hypothetical protein